MSDEISPELLRRFFPHASASTITRNQARGVPSRAVAQQTVRDEFPAAVSREDGHGQRYAIRITSFRVRLLDPDNLCGKWFIDGLRHAGLIPNDTAAIVDYTIRQEKAPNKGCERTEIEITPI